MRHFRPHPASLRAFAAPMLLASALASAAMPAAAESAPAPSSSSAPDPCRGASGQCTIGSDPFVPVPLPERRDSGVFISQVGETNRAEVRQASGTSFARVTQDGAENRTIIEQGETGRHYAEVVQDGDGNLIDAGQGGSGQAVLLMAQQGNRNTAIIRQSDDGAAYSAAAVQQSGSGNALLLVQDGSDNQARLAQNGNDNAMTATQLNSGNRLEWSQIGDGLADLGITQSGGGALQVTQSNLGTAQFAPPAGG